MRIHVANWCSIWIEVPVEGVFLTLSQFLDGFFNIAPIDCRSFLLGKIIFSIRILLNAFDKFGNRASHLLMGSPSLGVSPLFRSLIYPVRCADGTLPPFVVAYSIQSSTSTPYQISILAPGCGNSETRAHAAQRARTCQAIPDSYALIRLHDEMMSGYE